MIKNLTNSVLVLAMAFLASCSNEIPDISGIPENAATAALSPQQQSIKKYIDSKSSPTRSSSSRIDPYIVGGDTIMYLVSYQDGWELFSNSYSMPMILMKGEGEFNLSALKQNDAFADLFDSLEEALVADKNSPAPLMQEGSEEWDPYRVMPASVPDPINPNPGTVKTLVGSKTYPAETTLIDHLIATHWHQQYPYNNYMEYYGSYNNKNHIKAGCNTIALSQLFYYMHTKWGVSFGIPTSAKYYSEINQYIFSNLSVDAWNEITESDLNPSDQTSMFIGWIATLINVWPTFDNQGKYVATSGIIEDVENIFRDKTGFWSEIADFNTQIGKKLIKEGKPFICLIYGENVISHMLICDALKLVSERTDYYYAYIDPTGGSTDPDPSMPSGPSTTDDPYTNLVAQYGYIETETSYGESVFFKFNWGDGWAFDYGAPWVNGATLKMNYNEGDAKFTKYINYTVK